MVTPAVAGAGGARPKVVPIVLPVPAKPATTTPAPAATDIVAAPLE